MRKQTTIVVIGALRVKGKCGNYNKTALYQVNYITVLILRSALIFPDIKSTLTLKVLSKIVADNILNFYYFWKKIGFDISFWKKNDNKKIRMSS